MGELSNRIKKMNITSIEGDIICDLSSFCSSKAILIDSQLPDDAVRFLKSIHINYCRDLFDITTPALATKYIAYRENNNLKPFKRRSAEITMNRWKRKIRSDMDSAITYYARDECLAGTCSKKSRGLKIEHMCVNCFRQKYPERSLPSKECSVDTCSKKSRGLKTEHMCVDCFRQKYPTAPSPEHAKPKECSVDTCPKWSQGPKTEQMCVECYKAKYPNRAHPYPVCKHKYCQKPSLGKRYEQMCRGHYYGTSEKGRQEFALKHDEVEKIFANQSYNSYNTIHNHDAFISLFKNVAAYKPRVYRIAGKVIPMVIRYWISIGKLGTEYHIVANNFVNGGAISSTDYCRMNTVGNSIRTVMMKRGTTMKHLLHLLKVSAELDSELKGNDRDDIYRKWSQYVYVSNHGRGQRKKNFKELEKGMVEMKTGDTKFLLIHYRYCRFEIEKFSHVLVYHGHGSRMTRVLTETIICWFIANSLYPNFKPSDLTGDEGLLGDPIHVDAALKNIQEWISKEPALQNILQLQYFHVKKQQQ